MIHLKYTPLVLLLGVSCATVRPITYPSPCLDRHNPVRCEVTGYEVWGSSSQIQAQAKACPKAAHVTIDPHQDYGVIRCYEPFEIDEADSVVVVEEEAPAPADLEVTLEEAEAPMPPPKFEAEVMPTEVPRDQPRPGRAKRSRKMKRNTDD